MINKKTFLEHIQRKVYTKLNEAAPGAGGPPDMLPFEPQQSTPADNPKNTDQYGIPQAETIANRYVDEEGTIYITYTNGTRVIIFPSGNRYVYPPGGGSYYFRRSGRVDWTDENGMTWVWDPEIGGWRQRPWGTGTTPKGFPGGGGPGTIEPIDFG